MIDHLPFTIADIAIFAILLLSSLLAFSRGLVREIMAVGVWVGSALATLYGFSYLKPYAHQVVSLSWLADVGTGVVLFVVSFVLLSVVARPIGGRVRDSFFRPVDRSLGLLFGLARGAVLVCLGYMLTTWLLPPAQQPDWLITAQSLPYVERGSELLKSLVPDDAQETGAAAAQQAKERVQEGIEDRILEGITIPVPKDDVTENPPGYKKEERRDMERLIQSNQ